MPLLYRWTVDNPATHGLDSASVTQAKLNDNFDLCEANEQAVENHLEDSLYDAFGSGILLGLAPAPAYGGGLSVDVTAGICLIGRAISIGACSVTITANMSTGYLYLCQDGTFYDAGASATPPAGKSSFLYATYSSDGYDCLTVTLASRGLQLDTIEAGVVGAVSADLIKTTLVPPDRDFWIAAVGMVLANSGTYASTIVDVYAGDAGAVPTTLFTTQGNRPSIASLSAAYSTDYGVPDIQEIEAGQVLTIEVDAAATDAADLGVVIYGRYCDIS